MVTKIWLRFGCVAHRALENQVSMCTIAGLAQGWWSVSGLVFDIVGFGVRALDVGREYLRHRRAVELEQAATAAEWLIKDRDWVPPVREEVDERVRAAQKEYQNLRRELNRFAVGMAAATCDPSGKIREMDSLEDQVIAFRTLAKEVPQQPFKRAPIFTGILFVILGFVLQVVGAIPCS
jgi:hypothetical protein